MTTIATATKNYTFTTGVIKASEVNSDFDTIYSKTNEIIGEVNGLNRVTTETTGFTISAGTIPKTLTVPLDATVSGTNTGDSATPPETVTTIGALINGATAKTTPVDADYLPLMDSAASNVLKKLSWAYVKSVLKTYFNPTLAHGQCRLVKSGANLVLQPYNGNNILINGVQYQIPSAGVSLAPPATTTTNYFIYAYMNGATMTLEASATGHATDTTTGVEIKSGDATRTFVGIARTISSAWVDSLTQRFVASWFNKQPRSLYASSGSQQTAIGAAWVALTGTLVEFVCCGTIHYRVQAQASYLNDVGGAGLYHGVGLDGANVTANGVGTTSTTWQTHMAVEYNNTIAEGYHTFQAYAGGDGTLKTVGGGYASTTATVEG